MFLQLSSVNPTLLVMHDKASKPKKIIGVIPLTPLRRTRLQRKSDSSDGYDERSEAQFVTLERCSSFAPHRPILTWS